MLKIVADNKIPFLRGALESFAEVLYVPGDEIDNGVLKDADALITRTRTKCNEVTLSGTNVKIIASATIGFDHIDTCWCEQNGIEWTNAPGCNSESVKQYIGSVLALLVQEKGWRLVDKSIAVVGVGNVGSKVSAMARALGMKVFEVDPPRSRVEKRDDFHMLENVIDKVDIVTFHTPLTKEGPDKTYHLCNDGLLSKMKSDAIVVNSSRGEVVDGVALKKVLKSNKIGAAVLDVWEDEPEIDVELLKNVWIATPHIAGYSQDGKAKGTQLSVQAISRYFNLGIDNWEPKDIPQPEQPEITINDDASNVENQFAKVVLHTYPLRTDDADLRTSISQFEYLRGAYPVRREYSAYRVNYIGKDAVLHNILLKIGFRFM